MFKKNYIEASTVACLRECDVALYLDGQVYAGVLKTKGSEVIVGRPADVVHLSRRRAVAAASVLM